MAKHKNPLTPRQKKNIRKALRLNKAAIDKVLKDSRKKILKSHQVFSNWLLGTGGEDPKQTADGRH
jgi:hypothetical protein